MSDLTDRLRCFDRQTCTEAAERIETLEAELAAMRAGGEPVAEMVPCYTPSGKRVAVISRFQHLPIGTKLYTHPQPSAQDAERIQALELEVRQLTEQLAELRHAPTPQADSQPAPLREGEWINDAGRIKWLMWRVQDLEAKLAARAPADSVLEDAARYRWIRGPVEESTRYSRWRIEYWDGPNGWQPMQRERMDSAIDAAMNKGGAA